MLNKQFGNTSSQRRSGSYHAKGTSSLHHSALQPIQDHGHSSDEDEIRVQKVDDFGSEEEEEAEENEEGRQGLVMEENGKEVSGGSRGDGLRGEDQNSEQINKLDLKNDEIGDVMEKNANHQQENGSNRQNKMLKKNPVGQNQKVFEIRYTTPEGKGEIPMVYSEKSPKNYLSVPFGGQDLMTTPDQPAMDSPHDLVDNRRKIYNKKDHLQGGEAQSENSPPRQYSRTNESVDEMILTTPASAEEQLQIFQKATRIRNMHSGKKTQVHAKVNFVFYWATGEKTALTNEERESIRVEIMGEFSNWKPYLMQLIEENDKTSGGSGMDDDVPVTSEGVAATHFLQRDIDPKHQHFVFRIDERDELQTSDLYATVPYQGTLVNKVNLENMITHLVVERTNQSQQKSKESASQYTTFSGFLENEQKQINDERAMEEQASMNMDSEMGSPPMKLGHKATRSEIFNQSNFTLTDKINEQLQQVKITKDDQQTRAILCQQRVSEMVGDSLKNRRNQQDLEDLKHEDLYKDSFKYELDDVVHNSPMKESMQSCRSKKNSMQLDKMFQSSRESAKIATKKQSSTHFLDPSALSDVPQPSQQAHNSQTLNKQRHSQRAESAGGAEDLKNGVGVDREDGQNEDASSEEQMDIEATAVQLFNNMFIEVFEENQKQKNEQGFIYITEDQYSACLVQLGQRIRDSIVELDDNQEQIDHLKTLFRMADKDNVGQITKQQLIMAIQEDLKIQMISPTNIKSDNPPQGSNASDASDKQKKLINLISGDQSLTSSQNHESKENERNIKNKNRSLKQRGKMNSLSHIYKLKDSERSKSESNQKNKYANRDYDGSSNLGSQLDSERDTQNLKHPNKFQQKIDFYGLNNGEKSRKNSQVQLDFEIKDDEVDFIQRLAEQANMRSGRESMKYNQSGGDSGRTDEIYGPYCDGIRKTLQVNGKKKSKNYLKSHKDDNSSIEYRNNLSKFDEEDDPIYLAQKKQLSKKDLNNKITQKFSGNHQKINGFDSSNRIRESSHDNWKPHLESEGAGINSEKLNNGRPPLPLKKKVNMKKLEMNKVIEQSLVQNFEDGDRDLYEDSNNIRNKLKNKGDVSDRIIGMGWNTADSGRDIFNKQQDSPTIINRTSQLEYSDSRDYSTQEGAYSGSSPQKDSTLQSLEQFNNKDLPGHLRCENLKQVLEYIQQNKIKQFKNHKDNLECLFVLLIQSADIIGSQFEDLHQRIEEKEEDYAVEIQGYQETNMELEAELDLMEAELEKMKMYEQSYHTQEKKLKASLDRCDQTMTQKNNIETAHTDLLLDYNHLRNEKEDFQMENRRLKLEVEELNSRIDHLKKTILNQYERAQGEADKLDCQEANQNSQFSSASFLIESYGLGSDQLQSDLQNNKNDNFDNVIVDDTKEQLFSSSDNQNTTTVTEPPSASPFISDGNSGDTEDFLTIIDQKLEVFPSKEQIALDQLLEQEEQSILKDLQTYHVNGDLKKKIKNYIENNVQLNRHGLKLTIKKLSDKLGNQDNQLAKHAISLKFQNDSLMTDLKAVRFIQDELIQQNEFKDQQILELQTNLQAVLDENQQLKDEKMRIMGVNSLLEQKIQVERSEMMSLQNEVDHFVRVGGPESMHSGANRKVGKMSQYLRKQQSIIRSIRGSTKSGLRPHRDVKPEIRQNNISEFDRVSFNDKNFMKYQTKKHLGNQSDYRGGAIASNKQRQSSASLSGKDIVIDDDSSDSGTVFQKNDQQSASGSHYSQPKSIGSKLRMVKRNERLSHKGSINSSLRGSVRSGSYRGSGIKLQKQQQNNRVQVISDFGSEQSIDKIEAGELVGINQEILAQEQQELINKRSTNNYDLIGLKNEKHPQYLKVHNVIQEYIDQECKKADQAKSSAQKKKSWKKEIPLKFSLKDADTNSFYTENVKVYSQKQLKEIIMIIKEGYVYLIQFDGPSKHASLFCPPFDFLQDMSKLIYSEAHQSYIALKLNDVRATNGARDHIVLEICDRELFADFLMAHAEENDDEVIFELNEEFSMIINKSPVWFSFEDVERHKMMEHKKQFKSQDTTGFLEIRQNKAINYLKMMFQRNANWTQRYMSLQGMKLFIYQDQQYNKPIKIIELTEEMSIQEVRKVDIGGKAFVFALTTPQGDNGTKSTEYLAAANEPKYKQWLKAFRAVKDQLVALKQIERDRLKKDVASAVVKNERAQNVFLNGNKQYIADPDLKSKAKQMEVLEEGNDEEEEDKDDEDINFMFFNAQEMVSTASIQQQNQAKQESMISQKEIQSSVVIPPSNIDLSLTVVEEDPQDLSNN